MPALYVCVVFLVLVPPQQLFKILIVFFNNIKSLFPVFWPIVWFFEIDLEVQHSGDDEVI